MSHLIEYSIGYLIVGGIALFGVAVAIAAATRSPDFLIELREFFRSPMKWTLQLFVIVVFAFPLGLFLFGISDSRPISQCLFDEGGTLKESFCAVYKNEWHTYLQEKYGEVPVKDADASYILKLGEINDTKLDYIYYAVKNSLVPDTDYWDDLSGYYLLALIVEPAILAIWFLIVASWWFLIRNWDECGYFPRYTRMQVVGMLFVVTAVFAILPWYAQGYIESQYQKRVFGYYRTRYIQCEGNECFRIEDPVFHRLNEIARRKAEQNARGGTEARSNSGLFFADRKGAITRFDTVTEIDLVREVSGIAFRPNDDNGLFFVADKDSTVYRYDLVKNCAKAVCDLGLQGKRSKNYDLPDVEDIAFVSEAEFVVSLENPVDNPAGRIAGYRVELDQRLDESYTCKVSEPIAFDLDLPADRKDTINNWYEGVAAMRDGSLVFLKERSPAGFVFRSDGGGEKAILHSDPAYAKLFEQIRLYPEDQTLDLPQFSAASEFTVAGVEYLAVVDRYARSIFVLNVNGTDLTKKSLIRYRLPEHDLYGEVEGIAVREQNGQIQIVLTTDSNKYGKCLLASVTLPEGGLRM